MTSSPGATPVVMGRETDHRIAIEVMGWTLADRRRLGWGEGPDCWITGDAAAPTRQCFEPSSDIADAWMVVERMQDAKSAAWDAFTERLTGGAMPLGWESAEDTALSICRAALLAVGAA